MKTTRFSGLLHRQSQSAPAKGNDMPRTPLVLTPEQRKAALEKAAEAKAAKKRLLDDLRDGRVSPADLLSGAEAGNVRVQKLQISTLLRATPGVTPVMVKEAMTSIGISEGRRIQGLGDRQREKLLAWLQSR
jgi:hypothetical protein